MSHIFHSYKGRRKSIAPFLLCVVLSFPLHGQSVGEPTPDIDLSERLAAIRFESDLATACTDLAGQGKIAQAWDLLVADEPVPAHLAFRVVTVTSFLRNQSRGSESGQFGQFALKQSWTDVRTLRSGMERAEVAYWCAWISKEIIDDRLLALEWIRDAEQQDPGSARNRALREQLEALTRSGAEAQP